jgi:hypothetical protein
MRELRVALFVKKRQNEPFFGPFCHWTKYSRPHQATPHSAHTIEAKGAMKNFWKATHSCLHSTSDQWSRQRKSTCGANAVRLAVIGLAGCCLLATPGSAFAQFSENPSLVLSDYSEPDCSLNASLQLNSRQSQENVQSHRASTIQANDQTQNPTPPPNNEPSLKDLGFPPDLIKGNAQEQARLDRRSHMLQVHQRLGLITVAPLLVTLFTSPGAKGHHGLPGSPGGRELHAGFGAATAALYFSSAYFAIRAPKIPGTHVEGPIRLHKALAWIHGPGMILTPILGAIAYNQLSRGERVHGIAKYHSDVAWITAIAYGGAILSVSVKF